MNNLKILHTSDWHLGRFFYNKHSMLEEQKSFLNFLLKTIDEREVDLLIVAGDIYHSANPSFEVQEVLFNFFANLEKTKCKWSVLITGNHDSATALSASKKLVEHFNIFLISNNEPPLKLKDEEGNLRAIVSCIPYISDLALKDSKDLPLFNLYREKLESLYIPYKDEKSVPKILVSHGFFDAGFSKREEIGTSTKISSSVFDNTFDYIALGHIHSFKDFKNNAYYSGSPLRYNIEREGEEKFILFSHWKENFKVEKLAVPIFRRLYEFRGTLEALKVYLKSIKREEPLNPYFVYKPKEFISTLDERELYKIFDEKGIDLVAISYAVAESGESEITPMNIEDEREEDLFFKKLYDDYNEKTPEFEFIRENEEEIKKYFKYLLEKTKEESK